MAANHKSLQGQLLLDGGKLHGSFFQRSVVLICQHDSEGAFGLVLNRATTNKVGHAVVANLPNVIKERLLFIGGPVQPTALSFLHANAIPLEQDIMSNLDLGHSLDALVDLGENYTGQQKLRLFAGYAGWTAGQLDQEMSRQDWLTHPATMDLIFDTEPEQLWRTILLQKDVKYKLLADSPEDLSWN